MTHHVFIVGPKVYECVYTPTTTRGIYNTSYGILLVDIITCCYNNNNISNISNISNINISNNNYNNKSQNAIIIIIIIITIIIVIIIVVNIILITIIIKSKNLLGP